MTALAPYDREADAAVLDRHTTLTNLVAALRDALTELHTLLTAEAPDA